MNLIERLHKQGSITPPKAVLDGRIQYLCYMGSVSYGVSDVGSDVDIYGWAIPPKDTVFPHLSGEIGGFGKPLPRFEQYQQHHVTDKYEPDKEYDICIYNVVKFFDLCMQNNPNMVDALFVPRRCVIKSTMLAEKVRENRHLFLHKGCWHKFKGYAYSQMHKMRIKNPDPNGKRYDIVQKYGYDVKFAYHVVRLMLEVEQILTEGDLDLQRNREILKSIRRGEWEMQKIEDFFNDKERALEEAYHNSTLPYKPREVELKKLLVEVLEEFYADEDLIVLQTNADATVSEIIGVLEKRGHLKK